MVGGSDSVWVEEEENNNLNGSKSRQTTKINRREVGTERCSDQKMSGERERERGRKVGGFDISDGR